MLRDLKASLSVFLVALPLCLGLAIASGAPPISGLIAGIVGGIVIGYLSGSPISVSGPAAGLTIIVLECISKSGGYPQFLTVLIFSGVIQIMIAWLRGGMIGNFFPGSVINGLLSSIGLLLILKQLPHAIGYDKDYEGDDSFIQMSGENTFSGIFSALHAVEIHAVLTFIVAIGCMIYFDKLSKKGNAFAKNVPAPLLAVFFGTAVNLILAKSFPTNALQAQHLVQLPHFSNLISSLTFPDFSMIWKPITYTMAFTLAIISSLETLLNIDAADKLDPQKRITSRNRELVAQGVGNMFSGFMGGLPVTSVVVRTTVNVSSGARSKRSTMFHGALLILSIFFSQWINLIPLSALAAILIVFGFKLAHPLIFKKMYKKGFDQFFPFIITILAILFTNLLIGVLIGMVVGLIFVIKTNYHSSILVVNDGPYYLIRFMKDVSFLNKANLRQIFTDIKPGSHVIIDGSKTIHLDNDILETIEEFLQQTRFKAITFEIKRSAQSPLHQLKEKQNDSNQQAIAARK